MLKECEALPGHVQHIKEVVKRQQALSGLSGLVESASVTRIIEDALTINAAALAQSGISVQRELADLPPLLLDGVKLGQILVNLIRNAQEALGKAARWKNASGCATSAYLTGSYALRSLITAPASRPSTCSSSSPTALRRNSMATVWACTPASSPLARWTAG